MTKVVVTGGSGMLGHWVVKEFVEHGYEVTNVDRQRPKESLSRTVLVNLEDLGEVYGALAGADAVVHLGAIPAPHAHPNEVVFRNNVMGTYNVLEAAAGLGIQKAAIASSESSYGFAWAYHPFSAQYLPIDEDHPQLSQECYGLSKMVNEATADMFHLQTGMQIVSLRFGHVINPPLYKEYAKQFLGNEASYLSRKKTFWGYVDSRDVASAFRLSIEAEGLKTVALNILADDTFADRPTKELLETYYSEVTDIRGEIGEYQALNSNKRAKQVLGWKPVHSWRDHV